ncbi:MAG: imidazolonepropionase [Kiloniellales bacterium]|nr:imidazolonepropionase [Kiloniellales bacterium]
MWDLLYKNARLATFTGPNPYGRIDKGAIALTGGEIGYAGLEDDLPGAPENLAKTVVDLEGRWITPGLIDCHTHLVHGGDRAREFEQRLEGATYEEIAEAGGGIISTVLATRRSGRDELLKSARKRVRALMAEGVTTVEIKSGYGLTLEDELKQLWVARELGRSEDITVKTTFLGAHALPPEAAGDSSAYIDMIVNMMPQVKASGLADAVDAFCEKIAFSAEETARVFAAAKAQGLPVKLHADQLSDLGGAALAARFNALSADHLEYTNDEGVAAMAAAGTVAVLLPGAFYTLRETKLPPIDSFRAKQVDIALASDLNPGSSPVNSLLLIANMACTLFRMTPEESLKGLTKNAAKALGMDDTHGTLESGKQADIAVWEIETPAELCYRAGYNPLAFSLKNGALVRV